MNIAIPCLLLLISTLLQPKTEAVNYPKDYFRAPLDIPLLLAGNFGEPRAGHFHTGLDLQTKQVEGLPVYAAADGYVCRINVSAVGYGNALYIRHPNGYVTVYGHLKSFNAALTKRLRKEQYAKKSFAVDIELTPEDFPVKKGDEIALSGSTGSSGGPHLHFEIRDAGESPINPLLFGIKVNDVVPPLVSELKFYPMDNLKYNSKGYRVKLMHKNKEFEVAGGVIKLNSPVVGIALNTFDMMEKSDNRLGVYKLQMFCDTNLRFEYDMNRLAFTDSRYVLSQVDYPVFINEDEEEFQKCFIEPGNRCPIYNDVVNRGLVDLTDTAVHHIRIEAYDFNGNVSTVEFNLQYEAKSTLIKEEKIPAIKRFDFNNDNEYSTSDIRLKIPAYCLFDTLYFNHAAILSTNPDVFSKEHLLSNVNACFYSWYEISVKTEKLDSRYNDKALLVFKDQNGNEQARGGTYKDGFITTKAREFGLCYIKIDTVPPKITPLNITQGKSLGKNKTIKIKITDNLSGLKSYNAYLDNEWVLADFDAKSSTLTYYVDENMSAGLHKYKVTAADERGNFSQYVVKFVR